MILSASVHWREGFRDNTGEIERKTLWLQRLSVCLPPCMDFQKRAMVSFDTNFKSDSVRKKPCVQKTLKVSGFGVRSNHWLPNAYMLEHFYGEGGTCPFIPAMGTNPALFALMHSFAIFMLKEKKNKKHFTRDAVCPWRLISSHSTVHMKFDNTFYGFFFFSLHLFFRGWFGSRLLFFINTQTQSHIIHGLCRTSQHFLRSTV